MFWWGGRNKGGAITFFRAGIKGELAHHERFSPGVEEGSIHPAFLVFEDAHVGDLACEPLEILVFIGFTDSEENKEA